MFLNNEMLAAAQKKIRGPRYDRDAYKCGILHIGVGGFHRSHQAVYIDDLMNKKPGDWLICGVSLLPQDKKNMAYLEEQDGLYTVIERSAEKDQARIIGSIKEVMHAPSNPRAVIKRMMDPSIKIVSLTVTEKGYYYDSRGNLDFKNDAIIHDLTHPASPRTMYGYIVGALARRRQSGMNPFTVMSCDNLPGNGHLTQKLVLQFANKIDADLAAWIKENATFPNAMVDRITPTTTSETIDLVAEKYDIRDAWPVMCEDFRQWVIEDKFCDGRPGLERVGAKLVNDVAPYEKMKVRLLNGSHSAMAYLAYLMEYRHVHIAMDDPLVEGFVRHYMNEVTPTLSPVPGVNLKEYKEKLIERFSNPAISDHIQRLAEDGSVKIPNAILPCIRENIAAGRSVKYAGLAVAGWIRYLRGIDENIHAIPVKDVRADALVSAAKIDSRDPMRVVFSGNLFGDDLPFSGPFLGELHRAFQSLFENGVEKTLEQYLLEDTKKRSPAPEPRLH